MAEKYLCTGCGKAVTPTKNLRYRTHKDDEGQPCPMSSEEIPPREVDAGPLPEGGDRVPVEDRDYSRCHLCTKTVQIEPSGRLAEHLGKGKAKCPSGGRKPVPTKAVAREAEADAPSPESKTEDSSSSPESTSTPSVFRQPSTIKDPESSSPPSAEAAGSPATKEPTESAPASEFLLGRVISELFRQPASPFLQPAEYVKAAKGEMTPFGQEMATRLKEMFYAYDNRKTADNRTAQVTIGPSEIGTPCDRRLGMKLMDIPKVNPGGDGWAAFVGTCLHAGLEDMLRWADAGSGRFATEIPLSFGSAVVPKGTGDALDRVLMVFMDHKAQGQYSRRRLREKGPSDTYRVQVHTYAYGATLQGEKIKRVAIISWPRDGASLDELWVWEEPYDPKVAKEALARADRLAGTLPLAGENTQRMAAARALPIADKYECRYCPFHLKGDTAMAKGCPGA